MSSCREKRFCFEQAFAASPADLWALLGNTNHMNQILGLPRVEFSTVGVDDSLRREARAKVGPFRLRWSESPFEWIQEQRFSVVREFEAGPIRRLRAGVELHAW